MKKNLLRDTIIIILLCASIWLVNNVGWIVNSQFHSFSFDFVFFNKTILLSFVIIAFIIIFRRALFKNKIPIIMILILLMCLNFCDGYFTSFSAHTFIILYIYILLISFYISLKNKLNFELSVTYGFSILILCAFVTGLFGLLFVFKYIMIISAIYIIWYIYKKIKLDKQNVKNVLDNFFGTGFIIFNILWILAVFFGAGLYVHVYDEYSHWAYDAKATIYYSKFGTDQKIMLKTRAYPPLFTTWHYIVSIFGGFSEQNLYIGLNLLIFIYLLPAFSFIKNNNILFKILGTISLIFCCYLFGNVYSYTSLYSDFAITAIFASSIIIYFISKYQKINLNSLMILLIVLMTLSKTNGFVIALILLIIVFINELFDEEINSIMCFLKKILNLIRKNKYYLLALILTYMIWKLYLYITSKLTVDYYDFLLLPDILKSDLSYKMNFSFILPFLRKVYSSFDTQCIGGLIPLTLYQYIIISSVMLFLIFFKMTNNLKKALQKFLPLIISYFVFFFITVLSMFVSMSLYEASILASFGRYLNWYHLALLIFEIVLVLRLDEKRHLVFKTLFLTYIVLSIPFSSVFGFLHNHIKTESYNLSVQREQKVKILNENTPENSLIYVIDQRDVDGIMAMWYTRYYSFPRKNNATSMVIGWKIKTDANEDDLQDWGFTPEQWAQHLVDFSFDYVFLYSVDDYFFESTKFLFQDFELAKNSTLFKIELIEGRVELVPIK